MGIFSEALRVVSPAFAAKRLFKTEDSSGAANQYLNQIPGVGREAYSPYIEQGRTAGNRANQEYNSLVDNPQAFIDKILESYKPSQGYQFKENRLKRNAANEAAAGGFRGTDLDTENQSALINALLEEDMQRYVQNVSGAHKQGLTGLEGTANRGFEASGNLADLLGSNLNQQGGLAYHQAESKNARRAALLRQLIETGGQIAGAAMGMPTSGGGGGGSRGGYGGYTGGDYGGTTYASDLRYSRKPSNTPGYNFLGGR